MVLRVFTGARVTLDTVEDVYNSELLMISTAPSAGAEYSRRIMIKRIFTKYAASNNQKHSLQRILQPGLRHTAKDSGFF